MLLRFAVPAILLCAALQAQTPVLVELFTSEGCSDCPPADVLLAKLESAQPVAGAHIIALGEHVDYWDRLGWRDPFSAAQFSQRQQEYSAGLRDNGPYTPQMVVDGVAGFVGSDSNRALQTIADAARTPKTAVRVTVAGGKASIQADQVSRAADVWLAITESKLLSNVASGENRGRKLTHTAVVRSLRMIGKAHPGQPFTAEVSLAEGKSWKPENLHAVVFLQDRGTHRVLGAAEAMLATP